MAILNFISLSLYAAATNFYMYELFWGIWEKRYAKGFFYLATSFFLIYLIIGEIKSYSTNLEYQSNVICKLAISANLLIFAFTQLDLIPKPIMYIFLLNGSIFAVNIIILLSGIKHELFKD